MLLVIASVGIWTLRQVAESDYWVDHTRDVINTNQRLLSDVKDAESAERGYIITADDGYLERFHSASDDTPQALDDVLQLTRDNPSQQQKANTLRGLIERRLAILSNALRERKESGFNAAEAVVLAGQGRVAMQQIRDVSQEISDEEYRLLKERTQARQARLKDGFIATLTAAVVALIALIIAPIDVRRAIRQRDAAQHQQEESEAKSQALFEAAAQAIFVVDKTGQIRMTNPATEKMLGYAVSELIGQPVEMLVAENLRGGHVDQRTGYFNHPQNRPMGLGRDLQARRKDGSIFDVEISLSYIHSGQDTFAVAFMSDISKRKADEQEILKQRSELRSLAGRLMAAQDEERRRIARDLHDDLSQKLAYLAMDLGKLVNKSSDPQTLDTLRNLQRRAGDAADTVRHISHELHPSVLDDIGLEAALEQYCEEFQERSGIQTEFSSEGVPDSLPREVASSMYHIFQESLRNVSKHSQAEEVFVTLSCSDGVLQLTVRDEGVGLGTTAKAKSGIGIVGMRERAHLVNGTVSIESEVGQGTEVSVSVPLGSAG